MTQGKIIILNGTSSSGKTSIARALCQVLTEPYIYVSVDNIIESITNNYFSNIPPTEKMGEAGGMLIPRFVSLTHHIITALALLNQNVIADLLMTDKKAMEECMTLLSCYPVTFVRVHCPIEELERRELSRGDRHPGLAKSQFNTVHADYDYDITVDTMTFNPVECALQIKEMQKISLDGAFARMKSKLLTNS